ncbi:MAG: YdeI/OmpD-associated family protein [Ignavibacteriae bacterium]|nr:YdeI/OmpD-associated family protein [Ignavibacteriota bacterium]
MPKKDKRVDAYIAKAQPFAKPILKHLRELVHKASPLLEENMKWSAPSFEYKGNVCGFASFKEHVTFGFWKASIMKDAKKFLAADTAWGHLGKIKKLSDLPSDKKIIAYVKEAVELNEKNVKLPRSTKSGEKKPAPEPPDYFMKELKKNKKAVGAFAAFSPSHKREYIEWITEAKTDATRDKRIATAIEWMSEGKSRHWKYKNC